MADTNDGSIHIDSTIDTSGVKKGAKEIEQETKKVVDKVNEAGKSTESAAPKIDTKELKESAAEVKSHFQEIQEATYKFNVASDGFTVKNPGTKSVEELEAGIAQSEQALEQMKQAAENYRKIADPSSDHDETGYVNMINALNDYTRQLEYAKNVVQSFKDAQTDALQVPAPQINTSGFQKGTSQMQQAIDSLRDKFKTVEAAMRDGFNGMFEQPKEEAANTQDDFEKSADAINNAFKKFRSERSVPELYKKLEQLKFLINEMGRKKYEIDGVKVTGLDTEQVKNFQVAYDRLKASIENTRVSTGSKLMGITEAEEQAKERFNTMARNFDITDVSKQGDLLASLQQQMEQFQSSFQNADFVDEMKDKIHDLTAEYQKNAAAAAQAQQEESKPPYTQGWDEATAKIKSFPNLTWLAKSAAQDLLATVARTAGGAMAHISAAINNPMGVLDRALGAVALKAKDALSGLMSLVSGAVKGGLNMVATAATKAAGAIANMAKSAVAGGFQKLRGAVGKVASSITGVGKKAVQMNGTFAGGFKTVLKYAFGIRSLYLLFRKLRGAFTEGFANVLKYDTGLKATVDDFKTSLATLKNAVGAAVAPLVQAVLPVLTRIIDAMTEGVNKAGMLIAALTGAKQYTQASKEQAQAYQEEAKSAKEAQKTIAGFDDLTILNDSENEESQQPQQVNPGFVTTPIEDGIKGIADALKDMWDKADFTDLGRMLGERLRDALNSIPWDAIKEMCRKIGQSIATFLNGFFETPGLFTAIGKTIAEALNSVFEFLNAFVHALHWDSIGTAIKDGILGFLQNIDWPLIQDTFKTLGAGLATLIGSIVSDPTLPGVIGTSIANVINTAFLFAREFVTTLPWGDIGTFIHDAVLAFLTGIDWQTIYDTTKAAGEGVGLALENALDDANLWSQIFTTVSHAITALFYALFNFVSTPDWGSIGANIGNGLNDGVAAFPWQLIGSTIIRAVNGAIDLLLNFISTFNFALFGEKFGTMISMGIHSIQWGQFGELLATAISGLFNFFNGLIATIDWPALGRAIISFIAGFFGNFQWESVGQFISNCVLGLLGFLQGLFDSIDWIHLPGQIVDAIARFLSGVDWKKVLSTMFKFLGTAFISLVKLLVGAGGAIFKAGGMILNGLLHGIWSVITGIGTWLKKNVFDKIVAGIKSVFGIASPAKTMAPLGGYVIEGFLGGILTPLKSIGSFLKNKIASPVIDGLKGLLGIGTGKPALEGHGVATTEGLKKGISGAMNGIKTWLSTNVTGPVANGISEGLGTKGTPVTKDDGEKTVGGLMDGMSDKAGELDSFIDENVAGKVTGGMEDSFGLDSSGNSSVFSGYGEGMMTSMQSGIQMQRDMVRAQAAAIAEAMKSAYTSVDWGSIGGYMLEGLYNGLVAGWDWIYNAVTNIATSLLDAAKYALGIESPSKEFYWISEMITAGLTNGLEDTGGEAVDTVAALADEITEEAQTASPQIGISAAFDGSVNELDSVLMSFSDRVVAGFSQMIDALQVIATDAGLALPRTAVGAMAPYSTRISAAAKNASPDIETLMQIIAAQNSNRLTRDDIREILREAAQNYFNFDFYLGDEQVARSANRGNERLERRFRPVRS